MNIETNAGNSIFVTDNLPGEAGYWLGSDLVRMDVGGVEVFLNKRERHALAAALLVDPEVRND